MRLKLASFLAIVLLAISCPAAQSRPIDEVSTNVATGGERGPVVQVRTKEELERELCRSKDAKGQCVDTDARVIEVVGTIDFRGSMGTISAQGCIYDPRTPQKILLTTADPVHACVGNGLIKQPVTLDAAGVHPLLVGSNKTLIGIGSAAAIKGRGIALKHVSNVIIRNLTLSDINPAIIWGGDAVDLDDVDRVWLDHDRFALVGRQMIVGHFGPIASVNITWNEFDGKTPFDPSGHYFNILFNSAQVGEVVIAYNWFHDFSGRSPALHQSGIFYIADNYFETGRGHALEAYEGTRAIMDGNVFRDVTQPILKSTGNVFAPLPSDSNDVRSACLSLVGRACASNVVSDGKDMRGFHADVENLKGFKSSPGIKPYSPDDLESMLKRSAGPR